jgi:copper(I)-binding protein
VLRSRTVVSSPLARNRVLRSVLVVAAAALIPAVAGCEAGNDAPTLQFHPPTVGTGVLVQGMNIRNVFVLGGAGRGNVPAGGSAGLFFALVNNGSPDRLLSIQAPGTATAVTVRGGTIRLGTNGAALLTGPVPDAVLTGLTRPLRSGMIVTIVLSFQKLGSVTLRVPVVAQTDAFSTFSPPAPTPSLTVKPRHPVPSATPGVAGAATPSASASTP